MIMDEIKNIPEFHFIIKGAGRVDEKTLKSASFDYSPDRLPVQSEPKRFTATVKSGKTIYDASASFSSEGNQTLLRQFKRLIIS